MIEKNWTRNECQTAETCRQSLLDAEVLIDRLHQMLICVADGPSGWRPVDDVAGILFNVRIASAWIDCNVPKPGQLKRSPAATSPPRRPRRRTVAVS